MRLIFHCLPLFAACLLCFGCSDEKTADAAGKPLLGVGMEPLRFLVEQVAGDAFEVVCALPAGRSAHDYEPTAKETVRMRRCAVYFGIGLPYERRLVKSMMRSRCVDLSAGLPVRLQEPDEFDPHCWMHPENNVRMAEVIARELSLLAPDKTGVFAENCARFQKEQLAAGNFCREKLAPYRGRVFYIQHPSLGYFAEFCGLKQTALEEHASGLSAKHLASCAEAAKKDGCNAVLVQRETNSAPAQALASAIGAPVVAVDPLGYDVLKNMREIAVALEKSFRK